MISAGSPQTVTVFCLDVCPDVTSDLHPVMSENRSATSLLARPSSGGALTLTTSLRLHSSNPSGPERFERGDTETSISTPPSLTLHTSASSMHGACACGHMTMALSMEPTMASRCARSLTQ